MATSDDIATAPAKKRKRVSRVERSRQIWDEVEQAVRAVAVRRGWPHESFEDLDQVVQRLDKESPSPYRQYWLGLHACMVFLDSANYDCMEMSEVKSWQPMAEEYIKELEAL